MVSDAQTGAFKYIIVYMFDRFARNRRDSVMYKEMLKEKYGIKVISALEPISEDKSTSAINCVKIRIISKVTLRRA